MKSTSGPYSNVKADVFINQTSLLIKANAKALKETKFINLTGNKTVYVEEDVSFNITLVDKDNNSIILANKNITILVNGKEVKKYKNRQKQTCKN